MAVVRIHDQQTRSARVSVPGARGSNVLPTREPNRQLGPLVYRGSSGQPGVVERLISENARIRRGITALYDLTTSAEWAVRPVEGETAEDAFARHRVEEILYTRLTLNVDDMDGGGWHEFLRQTAMRYAFGFALFELRAVSSHGQRWIEAFPIHPSSVSGWDVDSSGRVGRVHQSTQWGRSTIDGSDLLHLTYASQGPGDVEGQSLLRPLVFPHESYRTHWAAVARRSLSDGGVLIVTEPQSGSTAEDRAELLGYMRDFDSGDRQSLILRHGYEHQIAFPSGDSGSALEVMRYVDALVDMALYQSQQALGATAGSGSRALGETLEGADKIRLRQMLIEHARMLTARLLPMIMHLFGLPGRPPILEAVSLEEEEEEDREDAAVEIASASMHDHSGCCPTRSFSDSVEHTLVDAGGREHTHYRPYHSVEAAVRWVDGIEARSAIDAAAMARIETAMRDFRAEMLREARRLRERGATQGQWYAVTLPIQDRAIDRVEGIIAEYESDIRDMVRRAMDGEAEEQARTGMLAPDGKGASEEDIDRWRREAVSVEVADRKEAAITMVGRVSSELRRWVLGGGNLDDFESRITSSGLFSDVRGVGNEVEATARIEGAPDGMVIAEVIRSSMLDGRVCGVCRARDGQSWTMPEDADALRATEVPDSECEGTRAKCRCILITRYARRAD